MHAPNFRPHFWLIFAYYWPKIVSMAQVGPLMHGAIWKLRWFSKQWYKNWPGVFWGFFRKKFQSWKKAQIWWNLDLPWKFEKNYFFSNKPHFEYLSWLSMSWPGAMRLWDTKKWSVLEISSKNAIFLEFYWYFLTISEISDIRAQFSGFNLT